MLAQVVREDRGVTAVVVVGEMQMGVRDVGVVEEAGMVLLSRLIHYCERRPGAHTGPSAGTMGTVEGRSLFCRCLPASGCFAVVDSPMDLVVLHSH